ncbi:MAG: aldo/keto reductase [Pseudomonadota bacterium]|nr:aldo/keto reductase [Pseudomonadota bacterium]MED5422764.1 aldo/keto reductase [Pseudomonadota bacterium]
MQTLTFNNGIKIPQLGYGTAAIDGWQADNDYVKDTILKAIELGYRHIDTASLYGNERSVGRAVKESGIPREEFFITTKAWHTEQGTGNVRKALDASLERLQMDYVDLYLIHWPYPEKTKETWTEMETLHDEGLTKALGLSNFRKSDIEDILSFARIKPVYNQLELHPYFTQKELATYCDANDIIVSCWSPLGTGEWNDVDKSQKPIADPVISEIALKYGVSAAQVIIKWDLQAGRIVIPKSETPKNMASNLALDSFTLSAEDMARIDGLNKDLRFGGNPDTVYDAAINQKVPA